MGSIWGRQDKYCRVQIWKLLRWKMRDELAISMHSTDCTLMLPFHVKCSNLRHYINGLAQHGSNSIANAMELLQSCAKHWYHGYLRLWKFDCLVQDCSNSIAKAVELLQSCTKPSISWLLTDKKIWPCNNSHSTWLPWFQQVHSLPEKQNKHISLAIHHLFQIMYKIYQFYTL